MLSSFCLSCVYSLFPYHALHCASYSCSYRVIQQLIALETNFSFWQCCRNWSGLDCFSGSRSSLWSLGNILGPLKLKALPKNNKKKSIPVSLKTDLSLNSQISSSPLTASVLGPQQHYSFGLVCKGLMRSPMWSSLRGLYRNIPHHMVYVEICITTFTWESLWSAKV